MKRLSAAILALALAVSLVGCGMPSPSDRSVLTPVAEPAISPAPVTAVPVPLSTAIPTENVQPGPRLLGQLKDVTVEATHNLEFSVQTEHAIAFSWIFTSPSSYARGGDMTVYAEELAEELPAKGFTVSGANTSTLKLTRVPYSLNGWTVQVRCFGKNGATANGFPVTITVTQPPVVTAAPTVDAPAPLPEPEPTVDPTVEPTAEPAVEPTAEPAVEPTVDPAVEPTAEPAVEPTVDPAVEPTVDPAVEPTVDPAVEPTVDPAVEPTVDPAVEPTVDPAVEPTVDPAVEPTEMPVVTEAPAETVEPAETTVPTVTVEPTQTEPPAEPQSPD